MIVTNLRANVSLLSTKTIEYRSMKIFKKEDFLKELETHLNEITYSTTNMAYDNLVDTLSNVLNKHAPIKTKKSEEIKADL